MALAPKPKTAAGYSLEHADACEQVLVTLLGAFGGLKSTLRLVGGLVPRYLTPQMPPDVPPHFGTSDVDIVLNLQVIAEGNGYVSLAQQLKDRGFEPFEDDNGWKSAWRWMRKLSEKEYVLVEFLRGADAQCRAFDIKLLDGEAVSALAIEHAEIVHDWFDSKEIKAPLLDEGGISIEVIRYADVVAFIILKALAFDSRDEPKDAGDLLHVMRYAGPPDYIAAKFIDKFLSGQHRPALQAGLDALQKKFAEGNGVEGYELTGPVKYAQFLFGRGEEQTDERVAAQRYASGLVTHVLELIREGTC
ncbi:hypothetical protein CS078_22450 [Pseudomonas prosekii]|uniref:Uncharacterized protein n=1 Tax=Pseudomonas prosekii TaxID=1148509 RepID=A0A3L8CDR1_9PSED|nr:hypothetical protein [Pseudomonas prosekii]RLU05948.1 hypothetical protein CS078_22450 [Pseudomonas prosekii]RLU13283.1 hypothetical protein CS076_06470 [Pseudomonas prosekii]